MASLMYGAELRLMECLRLRVQDIDFGRNEILVRDGKGARDRITMLPESLKAHLPDHLKRVRTIHARDLADGWDRVRLPDALDRKYPNAPAEWRWQGAFPRAPAGGTPRRAKTDVKTTMIYTHVLNRGPAGVRSPVDSFDEFGGGPHADPYKST